MSESFSKRIIKPLRNNFVERPWGGTRMREYKGLCPLPDQCAVGGAGLGEAFEIAAFDEDREASLYPSRVRLPNGTLASLPVMLKERGLELLGEAFLGRYGPCIPLLPKTLCVAELLSVQGHPVGNTEAYVILDAEPGATIRLGFSEDIDARSLGAELTRGRGMQQELLDLFHDDARLTTLHQMVADWFADRQQARGSASLDVTPLLRTKAHADKAMQLLNALHRIFWRALDLMNEIEVAAGQVIHNANPARIVEATGVPSTAEVHALGNPERREILALEVRRPGTTLRAWDNVRFPLRDIDVHTALDVLNLRRTSAEEFFVEREPVADREGVSVSVDSEYFRIEHLMPAARNAVDVPQEQPHCLHAIAGAVTLTNSQGEPIGELVRGESAIVPVGVGAYHVHRAGGVPEVVKVSLP